MIYDLFALVICPNLRVWIRLLMPKAVPPCYQSLPAFLAPSIILVALYCNKSFAIELYVQGIDIFTLAKNRKHNSRMHCQKFR